MPAKKVLGKIAEAGGSRKPARSATARAPEPFTAEERAAMKEYVQERKAAARRSPRKADGESDLLAKIAEMPEPDRSLATRVHSLIKAAAPALEPRTWYGMPAYANENGDVVCFFQNGQKFKTRYATLGFSDKAKFDDGNIWPTAFALTELTPRDEARIAELVRTAVS